jgi:hypothetical protein
MKLTTDLHLVLKLRMHGAYASTPTYMFMVWYLIKHRVNFIRFVCRCEQDSKRIAYMEDTRNINKILFRNPYRKVCDSIVGWGTMLQAGRLRVRVPMRWIFFQLTSFKPHYDPGVDLAYDRSEYQVSSWGVKGGQQVRLTTLSPSVSWLCRRCGSPNLSQPYGSSRPVNRDNFTSFFIYNPYRKRPLRDWEDNIEMDVREIAYEPME